MSSYDPLDDVPHSVRVNISSPRPPSHYSIVTATPSPTWTHDQQVMSPSAPLGQDSALSVNQHLQQQQQHQNASSATASAADLRADGSVMFKSLSQVIIPPDLISRLEALQRLELGQLADLDHVRHSMQGMADELFRRSELLGQCVLKAAEGSKENREQIAQLQASVGELQSQGVHQGQKLVSLSTEHDRTMSLLAEFESSMKETWSKAVQRLTKLEGSFETVLAAQAGMREDCEGWLDKSAEEQKQYLVVMLGRQAATLEAVSRKQIASDEQIVQLKQSLDKAQVEAVAVNNKYEQNLEQTRWVVTKVAELEGLVAKLRQRDVNIQREMGVGMGLMGFASSSSQRNAVGSAATLSGPLYYAMTPDLPAAQEDDEHDDGGDGWWGDEREWVGKDLEASVPPGLSFGPCTPPPPCLQT